MAGAFGLKVFLKPSSLTPQACLFLKPESRS